MVPPRIWQSIIRCSLLTVYVRFRKQSFTACQTAYRSKSIFREYQIVCIGQPGPVYVPGSKRAWGQSIFAVPKLKPIQCHQSIYTEIWPPYLCWDSTGSYFMQRMKLRAEILCSTHAPQGCLHVICNPQPRDQLQYLVTCDHTLSPCI